MVIICPHCKKKADLSAGKVNAAKKRKSKVYCSKKCSGLGRRKNYTSEQKKAMKAAYDKKLRQNLWYKIWKDFEFRVDYEYQPEKYRKERQRRMKAHVEYCRQPRYRKYKKQYDHKHKLQKKYGEFWEAGSVLLKLKEALPSSKEIKYELGLINKTKKRKQRWQQNQKQSSMPRI